MNIKVIEDISPSNKALKYIYRRILDPNYRGVISSQHNRYSLDRVTSILQNLARYSNERGQLLRIRTTDTSGRPMNIPEEADYAEFAESVKSIIGVGTQDSLRKNFFVDFHRMGLINRYAEDRSLLNPYARKQVSYVDLTPLGLRFISSSPQDQNFIYSRALNIFLPGYIDNIIDLITDENNPLNCITADEFMFFVSGINCEHEFNISLRECHDLIVNYRLLGPIQKKMLIETLKDLLKPENFEGNKTQQRDYHNWKNKADQMFTILSESVYFEKVNNVLKLSKKNGIFDSGTKLNRSLQQKIFFFNKHDLTKMIGFELHHVIPLAYAVNLSSFKALDNWKNMLYIDGKSHSIITQSGNKHILLSARGKDLLLSDIQNDKIELVYQKQVEYDFGKQTLLIDYNKELFNGLHV